VTLRHPRPGRGAYYRTRRAAYYLYTKRKVPTGYRRMHSLQYPTGIYEQSRNTNGVRAALQPTAAAYRAAADGCDSRFYARRAMEDTDGR